MQILSKLSFLYHFSFFLNNSFVPLKEFKHLNRVGNGLSNTFIYKNLYVIKIKNNIREYLNKRIYNGAYDNKFFYNTNDKFGKEFEILNYLAKYDLAPKAIFYNKHYLIIEYIDSIPLSKYIKQDFSIFDKVFEAVEKIHNLNIFHGDLNLDNILITKDKKIKFIDFESSFKNDLSVEEKKKLDYQIFEEKMKRFYPDIFKEYRAKYRKSN